MPYCSASSVIVNSSVSYSRTNSRRCSMGDVSRHGIEAPPAFRYPVHPWQKCHLCRWTEVLPMSPDRATAASCATEFETTDHRTQNGPRDQGRTKNEGPRTKD